MTLHYKDNGVWVTVTRPYTKRNGSWTPAREVWVKRSGTWVRSFEYDTTPPPSPLISLENVYPTLSGGTTLVGPTVNNPNHIKLGVKIPGAHVAEVRMIRVLSTYAGKAPTTQYGGTYTGAPDDNWPNEPWSDWQFNGTKDTSTMRYKTWTPSAKMYTQVPGGRTYYFSAWALDDAGLWSAPTHASIYVPKTGVETANVVQKEARFLPNFTASYTGGALDIGEMRQQASPLSRGVLGYGSKLQDAILGGSANVSIKAANLLLFRTDDGGAAQANIYAGITDKGYTSDYGTPTASDVTKLGTLGKGESKWFPLPETMYTNLKTTGRGFLFAAKDPIKAAAASNDFSVLRSNATAVRSGELHVVWSEAF